MVKKHINKLIGFDLDGTIIDMTGLKLELAKARGFKLTPAQAPSGVINNHMPLEEVRAIQEQLYHMAEYANRPTLMPGVLSVLERLWREDMPFVLISRRKTPPVAVLTLKHHGLWPRFFNEKNAHFVVTPEDKNTKAIALGVTHYLDDEPETLGKMPYVKHRILYDPHRVLAHVREYKHACSWVEVEKLLFTL